MIFPYGFVVLRLVTYVVNTFWSFKVQLKKMVKILVPEVATNRQHLFQDIFNKCQIKKNMMSWEWLSQAACYTGPGSEPSLKYAVTIEMPSA